MPPWAEGPCSQAWEAQGPPRCLQNAHSLGSLICPTGQACISNEVSMETVQRETAPPPVLPRASCVFRAEPCSLPFPAFLEEVAPSPAPLSPGSWLTQSPSDGAGLPLEMEGVPQPSPS